MSMDFRRRLRGLQERLEKEKVDLVVYGSCQNFQYVTGLYGGGTEAVLDWRSSTDLGSGLNNVFISRERARVDSLKRRYGTCP